jgi:hypothetical protein
LALSVEVPRARQGQDRRDPPGRSLAKTILEFAVRMGKLQTNPFRDVERLATTKTHRYVTDGELELALQVGRRMGGAQHIVALALKTAYLCVRRSVEVRALTRARITDQGISWLPSASVESRRSTA